MGPQNTDTVSHEVEAAVGAARAFDPCMVLMIGLAMGFLLLAWRAPATADPTQPLPSSLETVDPNRVPWWELTVLPGIGETRARAIVNFRESGGRGPDDRGSGPVFRYAADLAQVRGIGPKTVARLAPHLRFDDS